MNNLIGAISLLGLAIPGFFINSLVLKKERSSKSLALSWLTGSAIFTLILHVINTYLGVPLNQQSSAITLVILSLASFIVARKNIALPKIDFKNNKILIGVSVVIAVLMFTTSLFYPVADWDAVTLFDFRARILVNEGFLTNNIINMVYGGYPMYTSLLHFWTYVTGLSSPMPIYPLFTISLFAGIYFSLKRFLSKKIALLTALACILTPRIFANSFIAYSNLPYAVFLILGAIYIFLWTKDRDWRALAMGIILSTITFWVRSFPFAIVSFSLIFLAIPFVKKYSKLLTVFTLVLLLGTYFIPAFHPTADFLKWAVFGYYSPYWIIFAGVFIYKLATKSKDWYWALAYIGYSLVLLVGTYIFESRFPGYSVSYNDAVRRMTIFINPIAILLTSTLLPDQNVDRVDKVEPCQKEK